MAEGPSPSLRRVKGTIEPPTIRLPDLTARSSELLHLEVMRDSGEAVPSPSERLEFAVDEDMGEEYCTWIDVEVPEDSSSGGTGVAAKPKSKRKQR